VSTVTLPTVGERGRGRSGVQKGLKLHWRKRERDHASEAWANIKNNGGKKSRWWLSLGVCVEQDVSLLCSDKDELLGGAESDRCDGAFSLGKVLHDFQVGHPP